MVENRITRYERELQLKDLQVINDKRRQQRELLEQERLIEKEYNKEMYMYQRGLIDTPPESLKKRLSAIQASREEQDASSGQDDGRLEYRVVVKGKILPSLSVDEKVYLKRDQAT